MKKNDITKVTIYDVADSANVSLSTVSRVLNSPEKVKQQTRERVLKVIEELDFTPNLIARGLASKKTTSVAVVVEDFNNTAITEMVSGITDIAKLYGYTVKLLVRDLDSDDTKPSFFKKVLGEQVDGIIYITHNLNEEDKEYVKNIQNTYKVPFIITSSNPNDDDISSVSIDYKKSAYDITKHLIDKNRKNICLLIDDDESTVESLRLKGYEEALKEAGVNPVVFKFTSNRPHAIRSQMESIISQNNFDGCVTSRDSYAILFLNIAEEKGIKCPSQISICSMQNTRLALLSRPKLSCVNKPVHGIGAVAMRVLTKLLSDDISAQGPVTLPHSLAIRGTS